MQTLGLLALSLYASDPRVVWRGPEVNLLGGPSPDGSLISYVDRGDLAVRDLRANTSRRLTHQPEGSKEFAYFSVFSPDSKRVAFAWFNNEGFYDLRVVDTEGGDARTLYRNEEAGFVQPCAWTPDGRFILTLLFRRDNISQIALVPAEGGAPKILKSLNWVYPKKMDISPDGRFIAYDAPSNEETSSRSAIRAEIEPVPHRGFRDRTIFVLAIDGSREANLVDTPGSFHVFPLWARDGSRIFFMRGEDLWVIPVKDGAAAGERYVVKAGLGRALPMGITKNGELLYGLRTGKTDVFVADLDDPVKTARRATIRFPGVNRRPTFSPDGKSLAYLSRRGSENYGLDYHWIAVRHIEGEGESEIVPKLSHIERIRWGSQGWILASGSDSKGRAGLYRVSTGTNGPTLTVADEAGADYRGVEGLLWDNDGPRFIGHPGEHVVASPDRKLIAVADAARVRIVTRDGKHVREIAFEGATDIDWQKELVAARGSELWVLSDPPRKLDMPTNLLPGFSLHPDGKRIALTAGEESSEIRALSLDTLQVPSGLDAYLPVPESNPLTRAKVELGRKLFFDKRLSQDHTISCATCHDPAKAFTDARPVAIGIRGQKGEKRTPRIANRVYGKSFFWDGRAKSLEEQVLGPIENPKEMNLAPTEAAARVSVDLVTMQQALATYVRSILSGDSPYDRYVLNGEATLTDQQKLGLRLFRGKAGCAVCHVGPNFTDEKLHNTGAGAAAGAFKTPSLRDVARTPPYMHDGSLATLDEVIDFYDKGGVTSGEQRERGLGSKNPSLDSDIRPLNLNPNEKKALVAFLSALNGVIREGM